MGIEKDINQRKFRNEYQKSIINLIYTYNWMTEQLKKEIETFGLTMQQFNILRILRGSETPLSTLQIRERMLDKMSDTSRIVDRLIIKGLVKKMTCKTDKRLVDVIITDKGKKLLGQIDEQEEKMDNILNTLSLPEAKTLNKLLDKIRQSD
ncbi:MAG TPA: MarR family transcriptional regulator [Ferruginibacter sp.]|nr:MarR family transcriptional regulator [Ferruginibacter sp.]